MSKGRVFIISRCRRVGAQWSDAQFWSWQEEPGLTETEGMARSFIAHIVSSNDVSTSKSNRRWKCSLDVASKSSSGCQSINTGDATVIWVEMICRWHSRSGTRQTSQNAERYRSGSPALASFLSSTFDVTLRLMNDLNICLCTNREQGTMAVHRFTQHNATFTTQAYHHSYLNFRIY